MQEIEKEVWEKDASGKRKLRLVQETGYKYEEDLEGGFLSGIFLHLVPSSNSYMGLCFIGDPSCLAPVAWPLPLSR